MKNYRFSENIIFVSLAVRPQFKIEGSTPPSNRLVQREENAHGKTLLPWIPTDFNSTWFVLFRMKKYRFCVNIIVVSLEVRPQFKNEGSTPPSIHLVLRETIAHGKTLLPWIPTDFNATWFVLFRMKRYRGCKKINVVSLVVRPQFKYEGGPISP